MILRLTQQRFQLILKEGKQKLEEEREDERKSIVQDDHFSSHKIDPIPSIIYTMPSKQKTTKNSTGNTAGRPAGTANFSVTELTDLFNQMEIILPVGSDQWVQLAQIHADKYPGRCLAAIRRKYNSLARQKTPTGDPLCPPFVKWAKRIKWRLATKVEVGHCEERFDLVDGHPNAYTEPEAVPPPVADKDDATTPGDVATTVDGAAAGTLTSSVTYVSASNTSKRSYNKTDTFIESMQTEMKTAVAAQNQKFDKLQDSISSLVTALLAGKKREQEAVNETDSDSSDSDDDSILLMPPPTKTVRKRLGGKRVKRSNPRYAV